ncbi:YbaK/EbsC family protein [Pyxidicoccus parkwayensis]|jgi:Ala-tRNA(Pro) deacylase|uniref:YbaK/EbsC family protein n=1 Tax=Pyxidicoccus parkwayensis TaxID=2813578 RepID=A0ABX7NTU7_9BACT|nr:YbaK/EbsC family protein [Pyxidicoccus parkwaysis]QSQ21804.1 YbaK/EbsC family protein [Pyxidicoccus parkwaysis]
MIPGSIIEYLQRYHVPFERRPHLRAISAQALAASLHVTGFQVAKTVIVHAADRLWLCVVSAPDTVDLGRVSEMLGVRRLRLADESEFIDLFPGCEAGAEPPFGQLYGLPVVVDTHLRHAERLWFRAGSHTEAIELRFEDFLLLEEPLLGPIASERPGELTYAPVEMHA